MPLWRAVRREAGVRVHRSAGVGSNKAANPALFFWWRQVPLDTLSAELEAHLGTLKQRLVEVINEDYADFVSLSGKLVNVDGAVLRMHRPLLEVQARPRPCCVYA